MDLFWFVGFVTSVYIAIFHLNYLWKIFRCYVLTNFGLVKDLRSYGEWAVVTGATDGIGKEYAKQLAGKGLNIVLISRTLSKLEEVAREIEAEASVKTKIIKFDFVKDHDYDIIEKELNHLDIGVLINNAGMAYGSRSLYHESNMELVSDIITCNIFSVVHLTHIVLKGMIKRKRGAMVHIASASILLNIPYANVYSSTKIFMQKFTKSLQLENAGVVDHQILIPMYVSSKMSNQKPGFTIPTAKEYVQQAIRLIGIAEVTCGYWSHEVLYFFMAYIVPEVIVNFIFSKTTATKLKGH